MVPRSLLWVWGYGSRTAEIVKNPTLSPTGLEWGHSFLCVAIKDVHPQRLFVQPYKNIPYTQAQMRPDVRSLCNAFLKASRFKWWSEMKGSSLPLPDSLLKSEQYLVISSLEVELPVITRDRRHKTDFKMTVQTILYNATCRRRRDNEPETGDLNCKYGFKREMCASLFNTELHYCWWN